MAKEIAFTCHLMVTVPESATDAVDEWLSEFASEIRTRVESLGLDSEDATIETSVDGHIESY